MGLFIILVPTIRTQIFAGKHLLVLRGQNELTIFFRYVIGSIWRELAIYMWGSIIEFHESHDENIMISGC